MTTPRTLTFLSARPGRGATLSWTWKPPKRGCFYPHAPGGARPGGGIEQHVIYWRFLSARPGRGATKLNHTTRQANGCFYPHAPGGARHMNHADLPPHLTFLSARPGRGATSIGAAGTGADIVSIRTPRAGRDNRYYNGRFHHGCFYPHAPGGARLPSRCHLR